MKKKLLTRVLAIGLSIVMTLGLTACGGDDNVESGGSNSGKKDGTVNATLAKENVYRLDPVTIPNLKKENNTDIYLQDMLQTDTDVYGIIQKNMWDEVTYENTVEYYLFQMNMDSRTVTNTKLVMPDEKKDAETTPEGGEASEEEGEAPIDSIDTGYSYENSSYSNFFFTEGGKLNGLKIYYKESEVNGEYSSENRSYLCQWNADGSFCGENELSELQSSSDQWMSVMFAFPAEDGTANLIVSDSMGVVQIYNYSLDGQLKNSKPLSDELQQVLNNRQRTFTMANGKIRAVYYEENDWQKLHMGDINFATGQMENVVDVPEIISNTWDYNYMGFGENGELIYSTSSGLNIYTAGDAEAKPMVNFVNSDLFINSLNNMILLNSESFLAFYTEDWEKGLEAGIFTYVKPEDIPDKSVMVLAGSGFDYNIRKRVVDFNKNNSDYRIVMKDYSQYNTMDDYTAGITRLNNDIIAGNMPDMLINTEYNSLPIESYISKGLLADIGKFIAEDPELSQTEFVQNVFDAYSVDGVLYQIIPSFHVSTMLAKKSLVGNVSNWNMKEMQNVLKTMGPDAKAFPDTVRMSFMDRVMSFCGNQFINLEEGTCNFNSEDFISMMEFAKTLPEEINYDDSYWENYDWEKQESAYRENRTLLYNFYIYSFQDMARQLNGTFGEPVSFVGFPTGTGDGSYITCDESFLISSKTSCSEGAWKFLRYYLTEEYQKTLWNLPVNKKVFTEKSKEAMERPFWTDGNGEKQYYDLTMSINGEEIVIEPLNQQQLDEVVNFIFSITNTQYTDTNVTQIVTEEIGAYFSGQKSAQEVADVIQRRVKVYVEEM